MATTTPGGSFRINNEADLKKAISAAGSVSGEEEKRRVRRLVMRKARSMGKGSMIPPNWNADGSTK